MPPRQERSRARPFVNIAHRPGPGASVDGWPNGSSRRTDQPARPPARQPASQRMGTPLVPSARPAETQTEPPPRLASLTRPRPPRDLPVVSPSPSRPSFSLTTTPSPPSKSLVPKCSDSLSGLRETSLDRLSRALLSEHSLRSQGPPSHLLVSFLPPAPNPRSHVMARQPRWSVTQLGQACHQGRSSTGKFSLGGMIDLQCYSFSS